MANQWYPMTIQAYNNHPSFFHALSACWMVSIWVEQNVRLTASAWYCCWCWFTIQYFMHYLMATNNNMTHLDEHNKESSERDNMACLLYHHGNYETHYISRWTRRQRVNIRLATGKEQTILDFTCTGFKSEVQR